MVGQLCPIYYNTVLFLKIEHTPERLERGGPPADCETEVNVDSKRTNKIGPFLVGSLGQYKILWFSLGCSSRPSTKYFFPHPTLFQSFVPIAQHAGQTAVLGRLSLNMCLWRILYGKRSPWRTINFYAIWLGGHFLVEEGSCSSVR
jgi:hypothetical protein